MKVLDLLSLKTKLSTWGGLGEKSFLFLGGWGYILLWVRHSNLGNAKREPGRSDLVFLPQKIAYYFTSKCLRLQKWLRINALYLSPSFVCLIVCQTSALGKILFYLLQRCFICGWLKGVRIKDQFVLYYSLTQI